jgi:hypothetical protein
MNLWTAHCQEMTKEFQKHTPHQIPHTMNNIIDLMDDDKDSCGDLVLFWEKWLAKGSSPVAMILLKNYQSPDDYFRSTYNQILQDNLRYSKDKGYYCKVMSIDERNNRLNELYEINAGVIIQQEVSKKENHLKYPVKVEKLKDVCDLHFSQLYGVFTSEDKWVGYISADFCGQLGAALQVIVHEGYKEDNFIDLLWYFFVKDIMENIPKVQFVICGLWLDGRTEELRSWKWSVGLHPIFPGNRKMVFGY